MRWEVFFCLLVALCACENGADDMKNDDGDPEETEGTSTQDSDPDGSDSETVSSEPMTAIEQDFDNWDGDEAKFEMLKGDVFPDNNTMGTIDDHNCMMIHAKALEHEQYGFSVELELMLDQQTDMSGEDFSISFDVYVFAGTHDKGANIQFAFADAAGTPIYSDWWVTSLLADQWVTISSPVDTASGKITYSGFQNNPQDWIFDTVRLQFILNGETAAEGDEVQFCIDNLVVDNFSAVE